MAGVIRSATSIGALEIWDLDTGAPNSGVLTNLFRIRSGPDEGSFRIQRNTNATSPFAAISDAQDLFIIKDNGNVGIGAYTSIPSEPVPYKLDVKGSVNAQGLLCINGNCIDTWSSLITGGGGAGGAGWIESTSTNKIYITSGQRVVGIGILSGDTPGAKLEVSNVNQSSPNDNLLLLRRAGASTKPVTFRVGTDGTLVINDNNFDLLTLKDTNRVGIATTTSGAGPRFSVNGEIYSTGGFRFPDGSIQTIAAAGGGWTEDIPGNKIYTTNTGRNVGIGTAVPDTKLHVSGGMIAAYPKPGSANYYSAMFSDNTSATLRFYHSAGTSLIHTDAGQNIAFGTNGANERMRIDSAGNVGIGTAAPSNKFEVYAPPSSAYTLNQIMPMTSNTAPAPFVASSIADYSGFPAWRAFDYYPSDPVYGGWICDACGTGWLKYDFSAGNAKTITKYTVRAVGARAPNTWQFQGSNDDVGWTTLDTRTGITWPAPVTNSYTFSNLTAYRYYRINITANNSDPYLSIMEMEMMATKAARK